MRTVRRNVARLPSPPPFPFVLEYPRSAAVSGVRLRVDSARKDSRGVSGRALDAAGVKRLENLYQTLALLAPATLAETLIGRYKLVEDF